jgi:hypothetical protein
MFVHGYHRLRKNGQAKKIKNATEGERDAAPPAVHDYKRTGIAWIVRGGLKLCY